MCSLNDERKTPFHTFFRASNRELIASYRTAAETTLVDDRGRQLHHYIAWSSNSTIADIEPFVTGDALQQNAKDDMGRSALFHAAECGNIEILTYLLDLPHAPRLDDTDDDGLSLMHYAVRSRRVQTIDFLLQRGCSAQIVDNTGQTALHYAVWRQNLEAVKRLLILDGSKCMSIQDNKGRTPLDFALGISRENEIAEYLSSLTASPSNACGAVDDAALAPGEVKTSETWRQSPMRSFHRLSTKSDNWRSLAVAAALVVLLYYYISSLRNGRYECPPWDTLPEKNRLAL